MNRFFLYAKIPLNPFERGIVMAEEKKDGEKRNPTAEELNSELDELCSVFQGEIDKMMDENPDAEWDDFVKAADYEKKNGIKPNKKCEICGEWKAPAGEQYCPDCVDKMKHFPFEWWQFLAPVFAVVIAVIAFITARGMWPVYREAAQAEKYARERKLVSAIESYNVVDSELLQINGKVGNRLLRNQIKVYDKMGVQSYMDLKSFLNAFYTRSSMEKPGNGIVRSAAKRVDEYAKCYTAFQEALEKSGDFESLMKNYSALQVKEGLNNAYYNYYCYYACLMFEQGPEQQEKYLSNIKAEGKEYESLYLPLMAEQSLNAGKYDKTIGYCNDMLARNKQDMYAFAYKSVAYRMKGDLTKAMKAAKDGLKTDAYSVTLNYQMAIISMLEGQMRLAETYAETSFAASIANGGSPNSASLYALVAGIRARDYKIAGNDEGYKKEIAIYNEILKSASESGIKISKQVEEIINGEKTVRDVFMKGKGDFAW